MKAENDIRLDIIEDLMTKEKVLIKSSTTELVSGAGGIWHWIPSDVTMNSKYKYFDFNTLKELKFEDNYRIDNIFNGYAIIPTFELKSKYKESLKQKAIEENVAYGKKIAYFDIYEDNYFKSYDKVYNLKDKTFKNLDKTLANIEIKNNEVIGIYQDKDYKDIYCHFDKDFNFIKELTLSEYEKMTKNVNDPYDRILSEFDTKDCGTCKIVKKDGFCFIVDSKNKQITNKYNCEYLYRVNCVSYKESIEDLIFRRDEKEQCVFFNLKLLKDGTYNENTIFSGSKNGIVVGKNNCYAIINENEATIYNSTTGTVFGVINYMFETDDKEKVYLKELTLLDNFVYGKYVDKEQLSSSTVENYYSFVHIGKTYSFEFLVLNSNASGTFLNGHYSIVRDKATKKTYLMDNRTLQWKEFNYFGAGSKHKIGKNFFYSMIKEEDSGCYALYDENFNMIDEDIKDIYGSHHYICYEKDNKIHVIDESGKKICSLESKRSDSFFLKEDTILSTIYENGKKSKTIVKNLSSGKEKELPLWLDYIERLNNYNYLYTSNNNKYIVINNNGDLIATHENFGRHSFYKNLCFVYSGNGYDDNASLILNDKFEQIATVDDSFRTFTYDEHEGYEECYSYVSDGSFFVRDHDHNVIYIEDVGNFEDTHPLLSGK